MLERLGRGGMGAVYDALDLRTGARVAVKVITATEMSDEAGGRFDREVRAAAKVLSPHVVRMFDSGNDPATNQPFMVMERLEGEDVASLAKRLKSLPISLATRIAAHAALGLAAAHREGIIHRDIKPANLFLAKDGSGEHIVKILDFGIAKVKMDALQKSEEGGLTRTGSMLGSPHYMSPEQAQGLKTIDARSDVWSLGVLLYKLLSGRTPHAELDSLGQVILAICSRPAPPIQGLAPWVPPDVAAIVHQCLAIDPARRFSSMEALYGALSGACPGLTIRTADLRPLTAEERATAAPLFEAVPRVISKETNALPTLPPLPGVVTEEVASRTQPGLEITRGPRRGAFPAGLVVGVAALAVVGGGFAAFRRAPAAAVAPVAPVASLASLAPTTGTSAPAATAASTSAVADAPTAPSTDLAVTIDPPTATVTLDGKPVTAPQGVLHFSAPLGATRRVVLADGHTEKSFDVIVTDRGPVPSIVKLPRPAAVVKPVEKPGVLQVQREFK